MKVMPFTTRLVDLDGRYVPQRGDLARVLVDVPLTGGGLLAANQNVLVEHVLMDNDEPEFVGIKWRDNEGTHCMALDVTKIEIVP